MSIIQEALKRAQDDYDSKKNLPHKLGIFKKIIVIVFIIALCALITGFGIRILFSKMLTIEKEEKSKDLTIVGEKKEPINPHPAPLPVEAPQPVPQEPAARALSGQESQPQSFVLNGIMYIKERPRAIINGAVVTEGDVVSGATVTSISESKVLLKYINNDNKVEMVLKIKE